MTRLEKNVEYKEQFENWAVKNKVALLDSISEVSVKKGDIVTYTNPQDVLFEDFEVLGFDKEAVELARKEGKSIEDVRCVYLSMDCYWFAIRPSGINKETL